MCKLTATAAFYAGVAANYAGVAANYTGVATYRMAIGSSVVGSVSCETSVVTVPVYRLSGAIDGHVAIVNRANIDAMTIPDAVAVAYARSVIYTYTSIHVERSPHRWIVNHSTTVVGVVAECAALVVVVNDAASHDEVRNGCEVGHCAANQIVGSPICWVVNAATIFAQSVVDGISCAIVVVEYVYTVHCDECVRGRIIRRHDVFCGRDGFGRWWAFYVCTHVRGFSLCLNRRNGHCCCESERQEQFG